MCLRLRMASHNLLFQGVVHEVNRSAWRRTLRREAPGESRVEYATIGHLSVDAPSHTHNTSRTDSFLSRMRSRSFETSLPCSLEILVISLRIEWSVCMSRCCKPVFDRLNLAESCVCCSLPGPDSGGRNRRTHRRCWEGRIVSVRDTK
jgi:hypothetical protein